MDQKTTLSMRVATGCPAGTIVFLLSLTGGHESKIERIHALLGGVVDFQISPDGRHVVYRADQDTDQVLELYSVLLGGGPPIRLNPLLVTGQSVEDYQISPDGRWVVYRADQDTDNSIELYSVPIEGPMTAGIRLNGPLVPNGNVVKLSDQPGQQSGSLSRRPGSIHRARGTLSVCPSMDRRVPRSN